MRWFSLEEERVMQHTDSVTMVGDLHIRIAKLAFHTKESPIRTRDEVFNLVSS